MKKIMWAISFASLIGTAIVLQFMPDSVPMHYDLAGNIDRWGSKYESLIFPGIILAIALFMSLLIRYFEKSALKNTDEKEAAGARTNAKVIAVTGLCLAGMFTVMQGFMLYGSYKEAVSGATEQTVDIGKIVVILFGVLIIILGNYITKTRINGAVGFRIKWSKYNDNTWRRTNRFGAYALTVAGVVSIILGVIVRSVAAAAVAEAVSVLLASAVTIWYAHKVYLQELGKEAD